MIINGLGILYRISKRGWLQFCKARAAGEMASLSQFGGRCVGIIDHDITDWTRESYAEEVGIKLEDEDA